jgi:hypothetical protein
VCEDAREGGQWRHVEEVPRLRRLTCSALKKFVAINAKL